MQPRHDCFLSQERPSKYEMGGGVEEVVTLSHKSQIEKSLLRSFHRDERRIWEVSFEGRPLEAGENFGIWNLKIGRAEQKALIGEQL